MRIYISSHSLDEAKKLAELLEADGHTVTSTWHVGTAEKPMLDDAKSWETKSATNLREIGGSDSLVLIAGPEKYPGGKFVEAGFAFGIGLDVFNLGRVENGMMHRAIAVDNYTDLRLQLSAM